MIPRDLSFAVHRIRRGIFLAAARFLTTVFTIWRAARSHAVVFVNGLGAESAVAAAPQGRPAVHKVVGDYAWERAVGRGWFAGTIDEYQTAGKNRRTSDSSISSAPSRSRRARHIIVPSQYLLSHPGRAGIWITGTKISVIYNAAVAGRWIAGCAITSARAWKRAVTLITVCRLVPWKGVDATLRPPGRSFPTSYSSSPETGTFGEKDSADSLPTPASADRVFFTRPHPPARRKSASACDRADAFVLNSTYEGPAARRARSHDRRHSRDRDRCGRHG